MKLLSSLLAALSAAPLALALPITVDPAGTLTSSWSTEWETAGDAEGWSPVNATTAVSAGALQGTATGTDSRVQRTGIAGGPDLDLGFNDFLELRVRVPAGYTGAIQIFYGTTMTSGFAADRVITLPADVVPDDGAFHTYRVELGLEVYWRSTLRDLRVDAVDGAGTSGMGFALDYVRIGDEPGATVYQTRATTNVPAAGGTHPLGRTVISMESKHFRFSWDATVATHPSWSAGMPHGTLRNLEETWQLYVKKLGYREPAESWTAANRDGNQYKLNVVTWHDGYWAGGDAGDFAWLNITPDGLRVDPPTGIVPHELMHCFQMHNTSQFVPGSWWEGHANYGRERCLQHYRELFPANQRSGIDPTSLRCAHQVLGHGRDYYLSWPFFLYLDENPDALPDLGEGKVRDLWQQTAEGEYPMMTLERLTPVSSLKDIVGRYACRGATLNHSTRADMQAALASFGPPLDQAATSRWQFTDLVQRPDDASWWRVPYEMAPMQGAYALHELLPAGSGAGRVVTVNLRGLPDAARGADWRAGFIVISDSGAERYSPLWSGGDHSVTLAANENKLYLAVAGTPDVFHDFSFDDTVSPYRSHPAKARFPYEIQVTGATPARRDNGGTAGLVMHANGGGYKAVTATVAASAYLGPNARVLGSAQVGNNARIEDFAVVTDSAQVTGDAVVGGHALVRGDAIVRDQAKVRDWALVEGGTISASARVLEHGNVKGGTVTDIATVKGTAATLSGTLSGNAIIDGDYGDFFYGRDIANGIAFGHQPYIGTPDNSIRPLPAGFYAGYSFSSAHDSRILDRYGVTDGFTAGSPAWIAADAKRSGFLSLDGTSQYAILDRSVCDLRDFTFAAWVKPVGTVANQAVLWMGAGPARCLTFTPKDDTGKARFTIANGGTAQTLVAPSALPLGLWSHVAITLNGSTGVLYLNGAAVATESITLRPDQLLAANVADAAQHHYLGRAAEGATMAKFQGALDDVEFYGKALTAGEIAAMQPPTSAATAGTLHVDLRASDASAGSTTWTNHGTIGNFSRNGSPAKVADVLGTGIPGVQFNGVDQAYTGPNTVADLTGASDRSIEVWACNPSLAEEETTVSWGHRGTTRRVMAFNFGNHPDWGAVTHWGDDLGWGTPPAAAGWHHLVYTYDGATTAKVYLDGEPVSVKTLGAALATFAGEPLNLACQRSTANGAREKFFSGYLNTVRIHGGVLTAAQVARNFTFGPATGGTATRPAPELSPVSDRTVPPGDSPIEIPLTLSNNGVDVAAVTVSGSSSTAQLLPDEAIRITGTGQTRTLSLLPAAGQYGSTTITLVTSDGAATSSISFHLTVLTPLEAWRLQHFGNSANNGAGADPNDPDGDGQTNLQEYVAGTQPADAGDVLKWTAIPGSKSGFHTTGKQGRVYAFQRSQTLLPDSWQTLLSLGPLGSEQLLELSDPGPLPDRAFYRLQVTWPDATP